MFQGCTRYLCSQLFVQNRNIIVPLGLIQIAGNRIAQTVLLCEFGNRKSTAIVGTGAGETWLVKLQFAILFVNQEHVAMQSSALRWSRTNIGGQRFTFGDIVTGNIADQPVMPLEKQNSQTNKRKKCRNSACYQLTHFAISWLLTRWCVWVGHAQSVQGGCICVPYDLWYVFHLTRG